MHTSIHIWYTCTGFIIAISNHLCCLLHLQHTREVVMVAIIAPPSRPIPTSSQDSNENLQHADTLLRGCFCVHTLQFISIFVNFIHPSSWLFYVYWFKKGLYFDQILLSQSFQWYRPFCIPCHLSLHFVKKCFPKVGFFMRIIRYYGINRSGQKWSGKCMDWWIRFPEQQEKHFKIKFQVILVFYRTICAPVM